MKKQLSLGLLLLSLSAQGQVNNFLNAGGGNAAAGINYPPGVPIPGPAVAQPQLNIYAGNSNQGAGGESFIECRQSHPTSGNGDFFDITNASGSSALFAPMLTGHALSHSSSALLLSADIAAARDNGTAPLMLFHVTKGSVRLTGGATAITVRPLYGWTNNGTMQMMMNASGNLGIGTGTGAVTARLHTNGTVRHENLPLGNGTLLVQDALGNVMSTTTGIAELQGGRNTCATMNIVPKVTMADGTMGCSQIFDDGTSVGINKTSGFAYTSGTGVFTAGTPGTQTVRLDVNGLTRSVSFAATSDAKYKTGVRNLDHALDHILQLRGVDYFWKSEQYPQLHFDRLRHSGFIAQELMEVLPDAVIRDQNGDYAVDYNAVIPVLVEAIKEQQKRIEQLEQQQSGKASTPATDLQQDDLSAYLDQNVPNPFSVATGIGYRLPAGTLQAAIGIYDMNGREIRLFRLAPADKGELTIQGGDLQPGMYLYTLLADGKAIATKKMVLVSQ